MAVPAERINELAMKLRLSKDATDRLSQRAAESGRDMEAIASDLLEQAVTQPTVDEILAPFRKQVADSGMSDAELDGFLGGVLNTVRQEKKAKSV